VPNKPKLKALPGKRRAKKRDEQKPFEDGTAILEDLDRMDSRWLAAEALIIKGRSIE
jgi:hypothetical protein